MLTKGKEVNEMEKFIIRPSIELYPGIRVDKDTVLEFKNDHITQTVEDLTLHTVAMVKGEGYEARYDTIVHLKEGDILVYEDEGRGYIKPTEPMVTIAEAVEELSCLKE